MARFTHETHQDKQDLIDKAWKCKPQSIETHASHQGWVQKHPNGNLELLVSFGNLDKLLDDQPEPIVEAPEHPVVNLIDLDVETSEKVIKALVEPTIEDDEDEPPEEETIEEEVSVDVPVKKRGRPARSV